jgi:predicted aconitase
MGELREVAAMLRGKSIAKEFWITVARDVWRAAREAGYIDVIEESGAKVFRDTCVAVAPLRGRFKTLLTNSAKGCYYARGTNRLMVKVAPLRKCVEVAVCG